MISIDHLATSLRFRFMGCVCSWQASSYHSSCAVIIVVLPWRPARWLDNEGSLKLAAQLGSLILLLHTLLYSTILYYTILYYTILYYTIIYSTNMRYSYPNKHLQIIDSIIQHQHPILLTFLSFNVDTLYLKCWSISIINPMASHGNSASSGSQMLGKLFNLSTPRKVLGYWREIQGNLIAFFDGILSYIFISSHISCFMIMSWFMNSNVGNVLWLQPDCYCWHAPAKAHVKWIESWAFAMEAHWNSKTHAAQGFTLFISSTTNIQKSLLSLHPPRRPGQPSRRDEMMRGSTLWWVKSSRIGRNKPAHLCFIKSKGLSGFCRVRTTWLRIQLVHIGSLLFGNTRNVGSCIE